MMRTNGGSLHCTDSGSVKRLLVLVFVFQLVQFVKMFVVNVLNMSAKIFFFI